MMRNATTTLAMAFTAMLCGAAASAQTTAPPAPTAPAAPPTINQRLENQKDRIQAGTKDDELTKGERTRLRADDAAIRAKERVDRKANGGKLTKGEKKQIRRQVNRTSRKIYRARHNNRAPAK
jgi:phosphate-selective porin